MGKTTLARKYLQQEFGSYLEFPIAKETKDIASIEGLIEEKLRQLGEEPGREFLVSLDRLKRKLQSDRIGILIDNLEPALDSTGKFIEAHRRYLELLRVLNDPTVQSLTLITSRERLREPAITVHHYGLKSLDLQAWSQFFQSRSIQLTPLSSNASESALAALHHAYGGNAKAMDLISGVILEDFSGETEAYWQANQNDLLIERDLEDLVTHQFNRLQQLDPDAYNLLCRMGCYRYQDVPTVPIEGLCCLLWDISENRHRRVIKSLQDRSLVDCKNGEFWLHPVIRAEAISQLRVRQDWETANRKAAEFWVMSVSTFETLQDARKAFEACYFYIEISDFEKASAAILEERRAKYSRFGSTESLGRIFHKIGMCSQAITTIKLVAQNILSSSSLALIYSILGDLYSSLGDLHEAIKHYDQSKIIASEAIAKSSPNCQNLAEDSFLEKLKLTEMHSFFNIGICRIFLGDLHEAARIFEDGNSLFRDKSWSIYCDFDVNKIILFYLAFLNSCLGLTKEAFQISEKLYEEIFQGDLPRWVTEYRLFFLGKAYSNLEELKKSFRIYRKVLSLAEETDFTQVKIRATYSLAEIYRKQGNFQQAILYHFDSVKLADQIGARHDLAEAYYQLGLTFQAMDEDEKSQENFQEAIRVFSEMEAPKQVERVRRSMKNEK
ncbi:tetratricopeptide repeat protein [Leptolyngbyaceae cyanobacterium UHCC 1019]